MSKQLFLNDSGYVVFRRQRRTGEIAVRWWEVRLILCFIFNIKASV